MNCDHDWQTINFDGTSTRVLCTKCADIRSKEGPNRVERLIVALEKARDDIHNACCMQEPSRPHCIACMEATEALEAEK
jgi:hypothetical protein